jgi:hypothetical protein
MSIDLEGLHNNPVPWRVYQFFKQGGAALRPTPMGLVATFRDECDAMEYVADRSSDRISYRYVHEKDLPT